MPGIYLKCDRCGKTLGGEEVRYSPLNFSQEHVLRDHARKTGWTGSLTRGEADNDRNLDLCEHCSTSKECSH